MGCSSSDGQIKPLTEMADSPNLTAALKTEALYSSSKQLPWLTASLCRVVTSRQVDTFQIDLIPTHVESMTLKRCASCFPREDGLCAPDLVCVHLAEARKRLKLPLEIENVL